MKNYMVINDMEYQVPISVEIANEELFNEYSKRVDNKQFVDMDRLMAEGRISDIKRICEQCVSAVGMVVLDFDSDDLERYNKLSPKIDLLNKMANDSFDADNKDKGYTCLLETVKIAFDFYLDVMFRN